MALSFDFEFNDYKYHKDADECKDIHKARFLYSF